MNEDIWYEEELSLAEELAADRTKMLKNLDISVLAKEKGLDESVLVQEKSLTLDLFAREKANGKLRIHKPMVRQILQDEVRELPGSQSGLLESGKFVQGSLFLVRLGMELDIEPEGREIGWEYRQAWCRANLYAPSSDVQPRLLDIYPQRIYEGKVQIVQVKAEPKLTVGKIAEVSLGSFSTDLQIGQVTPVTLGFFGEDERKPYWELQKKEKPIRGFYHFWALVEQPLGCGDIHLEMLGEGDLRTSLLTIPVGPKVRTWGKRRSINLMDRLV